MGWVTRYGEDGLPYDVYEEDEQSSAPPELEIPGAWEPGTPTGWESGNQDWQQGFQDQYGVSPLDDLTAGSDWNDIEAWRQSFQGPPGGGGGAQNSYAAPWLLNRETAMATHGETVRKNKAYEGFLEKQLQVTTEAQRWARQLGHEEFMADLEVRKNAIEEELAISKQSTYAQNTGYFYTLPGQPTPPQSPVRDQLSQTWATNPVQGAMQMGGR